MKENKIENEIPSESPDFLAGLESESVQETKPESLKDKPAVKLERVLEKKPEKHAEFQNPNTLSRQNQAKPSAKSQDFGQIDPVVYKKVETVLAEGLDSIYQQMDKPTQQKFKQAGEETAAKISILLKGTKIKVKKIFELIVGWLKIIPGVNKFFLEQEAKIKADNILSVTKKK